MISKFIKDLTSKYSSRHEDLVEAAMEVKDLFPEGKVDCTLDI